MSITPNEVCAESNEEVMFTCSASLGTGNSFSWEEVASGNTIGSEEVLTVTALSTTQYKCTVENLAGSGCSTATLFCKWEAP